jgi:hypothetical protein
MAGSLYANPTGGTLQMPLSFLQTSPFSKYFWLGIILFAINGLFGIFPLATVAFRSPRLMVAIQGLLLGGWVIIQMAFLQTFFPPLHLPFLIMGATLFALAWLRHDS